MSQKTYRLSLREPKPRDPDFGLELSGKAQDRLSQARKVLGKTIPFSDIKKRYS